MSSCHHYSNSQSLWEKTFPLFESYLPLALHDRKFPIQNKNLFIFQLVNWVTLKNRFPVPAGNLNALCEKQISLYLTCLYYRLPISSMKVTENHLFYFLHREHMGQKNQRSKPTTWTPKAISIGITLLKIGSSSWLLFYRFRVNDP